MVGKRILIICIGALVIAGAFFVWNWIKPGKNIPGTISPKGGAAMDLLIPGATTHYRQQDKKWGHETIGGSNERIANVGCTLCSVAMAVSDLGHPINPGELNRNLIAKNGYTDQGWMIWGTVKPAVEDFAEVVVLSTPDHATIDACLKRGDFPIVKFYLPAGIPHWVVVVGKDGLEYLIKDPALKNPSPIKLSSRARAIHSLRYIRKH